MCAKIPYQNEGSMSLKDMKMKKVGVYCLSLGLFIISAVLALGDEPVKGWILQILVPSYLDGMTLHYLL